MDKKTAYIKIFLYIILRIDFIIRNYFRDNAEVRYFDLALLL